jgi:hypothetical protein
MSFTQHTVAPLDIDAGVDMYTAAFTVMERVLCHAIQANDIVTRDQVIQTWITRLHPSCLFRLNLANTIIFAEQYGLTQLLGPACLAFVLETPLSSYTWPTGAIVSVFRIDTGVLLTDAHSVRLSLGYYAMQSNWVRLREAPHKHGQCTASCLTSWLFQWSLTDQILPGQGNMVARVMQLRDDLLSTGPYAVGQFMTSDCWNAALAELDTTLESIQAGTPFLV